MVTSHTVSKFFYSLASYESLKKIGIGVLFLLVGAAGYGIYHWRSVTYEMEAQKAFADCLELFQQAMASHDTEKLEELRRACDEGYQRFKKSVFVPYFLSYKSDALIELGQLSQAIDSMKQSIEHMPHTSPLYYLYATKYALMQCDSDDSDIRAHGRAELEKLAQTKGNNLQDMALYYAGYTAYSAHDEEKAQKLWSQLIKVWGASSQWSQLAQAKLSFTA